MTTTIAVIEDELTIATAVAARLRAEGIGVELAHDGPTGVALCETDPTGCSDLGSDAPHAEPDRRRTAEWGRPVVSMIMGGTSHTIPISNEEPVLGRWQRLFIFELDEPRDRTIRIHTYGE